MKIGSLDTDSEALKNRIRLQDAYGSFNLNDWIFDSLNISSSNRCLDLGCGTGNQSLKIAPRLSEKGSIDCVDLSQKSIDFLISESKRQTCDSVMTTYVAALDEIPNLIINKKFDRIFSSYAMYYVNNFDKLASWIHGSLSENGRFFYCGPTHKNNLELRRLMCKVTGQALEKYTVASKFMETDSRPLVNKFFKTVEIREFENSVIYPTASSLIEYLRSHNLYSKSFDNKYKNLISAHFEENETFVNVKRGVGVLAYGRR